MPESMLATISGMTEKPSHTPRAMNTSAITSRTRTLAISPPTPISDCLRRTILLTLPGPTNVGGFLGYLVFAVRRLAFWRGLYRPYSLRASLALRLPHSSLQPCANLSLHGQALKEHTGELPSTVSEELASTPALRGCLNAEIQLRRFSVPRLVLPF
jgi:hypothetical protein